MTLDMTTIFILLIFLFSTFIRSTFGFGDALIAMPLLALVVDMQTATPLVAMVACTIAMTILIRQWRHVQFRSAWRLIVSTMVGIPIGLIFLRGSHENLLKLTLAGVIVSFSIYQLLKPQFLKLKSEGSAFVFGFFAGILGGAYNTNGPLIVIYGSLLRWPPETFRATLQGYFFLTGILLLTGHASAGLWTPIVLRTYLIILPVVLISIWVGGKLHHAIPAGRFDKAIHILLICIGLFLGVRTVLAMLG